MVSTRVVLVTALLQATAFASGRRSASTLCRQRPSLAYRATGMRANTLQGARRVVSRRASESNGGMDPIIAGLRVASPVMSLLKPVFAPLSKVQAGTYDSDATRTRIEKEVKSSPVVVYSFSLSPFCTKAIEVLKAAGAEPKVVELGAEWIPGLISSEGAAIRAELGEMTGRTSMPHIFIGGESIGGLADGTPGLLPMKDDGTLQGRLKKARAI